MLHPQTILPPLPKQTRRRHHQHPTLERIQLVKRPHYDTTMSRADWMWTIILAIGTTTLIAAAIWLNIGTR